jgi:hypothetical protein
MEELKILKLNDEDAVPENYTGCVEGIDGAKEWYKEGKLHRLDGPALEYNNGSKSWYIEDEFMKSEYGIYLTPGKVYKLTGEIHGRYFEQSQNPSKIEACLVLGNREEKQGNLTRFFSKVLLNNQIVELVFRNKTFEELE